MGKQERTRRRRRLGTSEAAQAVREPLLPWKSNESEGLQGSGRSAWPRASRRPRSSGAQSGESNTCSQHLSPLGWHLWRSWSTNGGAGRREGYSSLT